MSLLEDNWSLEDGEDEDDLLAQFLEAEVLAQDVDEGAEDSEKEHLMSRPSKRVCIQGEGKGEHNGQKFSACAENVFVGENAASLEAYGNCSGDSKPKPCIERGPFSKIPAELFRNILKFLSSEDLVNCAEVCQFMKVAASDESLWHRLYCMRWGLPMPDHGKLRACAWKQLYFERDSVDMIEFVRNSPTEFREYYIQMQAAKRSETPAPSQVKDDMVILDTTVAEQISQWKQSRGLPDVFTGDHVCSGRTCSYSQAGDVFLCEKTGCVHVCDDTCRETVLDTSNELLVCTISGRCFDRWLSPSEEEVDPGHQQGDGNATVDETESFMGTGRLARAYLLGYNCHDEKELQVALREVVYPGSNRMNVH